MTRWKMVPVEPTTEGWLAIDRGLEVKDSPAGLYAAMLAAAPEWEPSDEDVERALLAYDAAAPGPGVLLYPIRMRAALKAAIGGGE